MAEIGPLTKQPQGCGIVTDDVQRQAVSVGSLEKSDMSPVSTQ